MSKNEEDENVTSFPCKNCSIALRVAWYYHIFHEMKQINIQRDRDRDI